MIVYDSVSFSAGQECGARVAACAARFAALELTEHSRWWNRWRRRLMARALVACAEEMECAADDGTWQDAAVADVRRSSSRDTPMTLEVHLFRRRLRPGTYNTSRTRRWMRR